MLGEPAHNDGVQTFTIKRDAGTAKKINRSQKTLFCITSN